MHSESSTRSVGAGLIAVCWGGISLIATALSVFYVYYTIFATFRPYDDEGFIVLSLKSFVQGKPLYDEVFSVYQPAFYVIHWLWFQVTGFSVDHDHVRLITVAFWTIGAVLNGLITWRLTRSPLTALAVSLISVRYFTPFANEPGHPQALAFALVAGVLLTLIVGQSSSPRWQGAVIGALTALTLLIKINVGVLLLLPVVFIFAVRCRARGAFFVLLLCATSMIALPPLIWRPYLTSINTPLTALAFVELTILLILACSVVSWRSLRVVGAAALVGCVGALFQIDSASVAALPLFSSALLGLGICAGVILGLASASQLHLPISDRVSARQDSSGACGSVHPNLYQSALWGTAAFLLVIVAILLATVLHRTTLHGLYDGFIGWPAKQSTSFRIRPRSNWLGSTLGLIGLSSAYGYLRLSLASTRLPAFQFGIHGVKIIFGLLVLAEFYSRPPGAWTAVPLLSEFPHFWMLPFAWLVAVPGPEESKICCNRLPLLMVAIMQPLIACPVAGTQLIPASILLCVVGAVCVVDGITALSTQRPTMLRFRSARVAASLVAATLLLTRFAVEISHLQNRYFALTPLRLRGANRLRLTSDEVSVYQQLVGALEPPGIETFLTEPGMDSLYLWSGKEPPDGLNISGWVVLFDDTMQEKIWNDAIKHRGLVVVRNKQLIRVWTRGRSIAQMPLIRHIDENFVTTALYGGYELMRPK